MRSIGYGEGLSQQADSLRVPLTRNSLSRISTSPRKRGEVKKPPRSQSQATRSRRLDLEMAEHDVARLFVHFGLEHELVLQRGRPGRGRPCRNLVHQPF